MEFYNPLEQNWDNQFSSSPRKKVPFITLKRSPQSGHGSDIKLVSPIANELAKAKSLAGSPQVIGEVLPSVIKVKRRRPVRQSKRTVKRVGRKKQSGKKRTSKPRKSGRKKGGKKKNKFRIQRRKV